MVMTDTIADMLTRIRNANKIRHQTEDIPASKAKKDVLTVLVNEGFIVG
jgi:small subunit ribosomal protein S8